jgi:fatty acid desaturase
MNKPQVDPQLLESLHVVGSRHWSRLAIFVLLYVAAGYLAYYLSQAYSDDLVHVLWRLPLYLLAAASLHGISLFTHEGVHGTLCRNATWNRWISAACALPVLQNFAAYKVLHLRHHNHLGREGDPDHYPNYTRWTWLQFAMHWGRLLCGYPAYVTAIPILGFRQGTRGERAWIVLEVGLLFLVVGCIILSPVPWALLLHAWLIPMLFINTLVNVRGMSQHTLLEHHDDPVLGTRSILTNPLTRFFMCNENYHLEHHLYPGVPWYNLPSLHRELRPALEACGAPFIRSYFSFVQEFVIGSWRRVRGTFRP